MAAAPRPEAKSEARGRTTATERQPRQRSKSAANKTGDTDTSLSWNDIFANCNEHLRARACNRRMWYDDHDSHLCDFCKD